MILWPSFLIIAQFFHKLITFTKVTNLVTWLDVVLGMRTGTGQWYNMVKMHFFPRSNCTSTNMTNMPILLKNMSIAYLFKRDLLFTRPSLGRTGIRLSWIILIFTPFSFSLSFLISYTPFMPIEAFYSRFYPLSAIGWITFLVAFTLTLLTNISMSIFLTLIYSEIINRLFNLTLTTWFRENKKRPLDISYFVSVFPNILKFSRTSLATGSMAQLSCRLLSEGIKRFKYVATCTNFRQYIHDLTPLVSPCFVVLPERQGYAFSHGLITPMLGNKSILSFFAASVKPEMEAA